MTIDELAARVGMTARNIRAHQSRGLVPPPALAGRTGLYGAEHVARLKLIKEMQAAGFNLAAIKQLLEAAPPGSAEEVLEFERTLLRPWGSEEPRVYDAGELAEFFGPVEPEALERAIELGVLNEAGDGRFEAPSPSLLRAGADLVALGVPIRSVLEVLEDLLEHSRNISTSFVNLFIENVWLPFEKGGRPEADWPQVRGAVEELRPLATEALLVVFRAQMTKAIEEAFGRELERRGLTRSETG